MPGIAVRVQARHAIKRVAGLEAKAVAMGPLLKDFGEHMKGSIDANFDAGGRPKKWAPLKASTLRAWMGRYKKGGAYRTKTGKLKKAGMAAMGGRKILVDRGIMRRSVTYKTLSKSVQIFASHPAWFHHVGTKHMPARPFMVFQKEDRAYLKAKLIAYLMGGPGG